MIMSAGKVRIIKALLRVYWYEFMGAPNSLLISYKEFRMLLHILFVMLKSLIMFNPFYINFTGYQLVLGFAIKLHLFATVL